MHGLDFATPARVERDASSCSVVTLFATRSVVGALADFASLEWDFAQNALVPLLRIVVGDEPGDVTTFARRVRARTDRGRGASPDVVPEALGHVGASAALRLRPGRS